MFNLSKLFNNFESPSERLGRVLRNLESPFESVARELRSEFSEDEAEDEPTKI